MELMDRTAQELEKGREILKRRAAAMASAAGEERGEPPDKYLEFRLGGELYAVELSVVREVCGIRPVTPIPGAPPFMAGAANIRGQLLPVADIARFFGMAVPEAGKKIVILRGAARDGRAAELGILAEAVTGVAEIRRESVQPPPPGFAGVHARYLAGMDGKGRIIFKAERFVGDCRSAGRTAAGADAAEAPVDMVSVKEEL